MMASLSINSDSKTAYSYGSLKPVKDSLSVYHSPDPFKPLVKKDHGTLLHSGDLTNLIKSKLVHWRLKIRKVRSKGAILVLIWAFLMWGVLALSWSEIHFNSPRDADKYSFKHSDSYIASHYVIMLAVFMIGTPLSGWLADVYFGRYNVIQGSVWLMLFGYLTQGIVELIYLYDTSNIAGTNGYTPGVVVLIVVYLVGSLLKWSGTAGFLSNAIQFGIDQMPDASTDEVSAFIFWYVFSLNMGAWTVNVLTELLSVCVEDPQGSLITGIIIPVFCTSIILCSNYLLQHLLTAEPQTHNPLKLVLQVLKYAATHTKVRVRSAFTYMDTRPSRLDLGKSKFGGPFTTEEVEDVKTFLRILLLMCPTSLIIIAVSQVEVSLGTIAEHLKGNMYSRSCGGVLITSLLYNHTLLIALYIALYEFVIYPVWSRRIMTMLKRIGASACFLCVLIVILLIVDTVRHLETKDVSCMFTELDNNKSNVTFDIPLYAVEVPANILLAIVLGLLSVSTYEFVYAQSPYSMRGILIGFAWFMYTLSFGFGDLITEIWRRAWEKHPIKHILSCGLLFYSTVLFIASIGLVLFGLAACCYKMRVRDEVRNERAIIEEVYANRCAMENSVNSTI